MVRMALACPTPGGNGPLSPGILLEPLSFKGARKMNGNLAGVDMLHIPYKGSGPAMTDLLGGQVDYMFDSITV